MKLAISLFVSSGILISQSCFAKNQFVLIGGGGEPTGPTTIFDETLKKQSDFFYQNPKWDKEISFDGGHRNTENILSKNFQNTPTSNFTEDNYKKLIQKYIDQLKTNKLSKGDQLLIVIDSHGAIKVNSQLTHSIATSEGQISNYESLGSPLVNLDQLKELTSLAAKQGVRVGIIDHSCFSGNTLALANDNACVISTTGPNHYSYSANYSSGYKIAESMKSGKNLEDVFLEARASSETNDFPMISTPTGQMIQDHLYKLITPYLYTVGEKNSKFNSYAIEGGANLLCQYDENFKELNKLINEIEDVRTETKKFLFFFNVQVQSRSVDLSALKDSIEEYYKIQREMIANMAAINDYSPNQVEHFSAAQGSTKVSIKYTQAELISTDFASLLRNLSVRITLSNSTAETEELQALFKLYSSAKNKADEIIIKNPGIEKVKNQITSNKELESRSQNLVRQIASESRKLYSAYYKKLKNDEDTQKKPNPCKDFVL